MKSTYTHEEVMNMLTGMLVFSGANNNQGLAKIVGENYGKKAEHIIKCTISAMENGNRFISAIPMYSKDI